MHHDQVGFTQRMLVQYLKSNVFTSMRERKNIPTSQKMQNYLAGFNIDLQFLKTFGKLRIERHLTKIYSLYHTYG